MKNDVIRKLRENMVDYIIVGHGEITKIPSNTHAEGDALGPCMGIAILDKKSKTGYMTNCQIYELEKIDKTLQIANRDYGDLSSLVIAIGGGHLTLDYEGPDDFSADFNTRDSDNLRNANWQEVFGYIKNNGLEGKRNLRIYKTEKRNDSGYFVINTNDGYIKWNKI